MKWRKDDEREERKKYKMEMRKVIEVGIQVLWVKERNDNNGCV